MAGSLGNPGRQVNEIRRKDLAAAQPEHRLPHLRHDPSPAGSTERLQDD
jgi:hypothetical protein